MKRCGSVMLEAVIVLPVFVFILFLLIQATFVWTARQMTVYAAYCAARAALVYNPKDYSANDSGVAHKAACTVLSWISFSDKGSNPIKISTSTGTYDVPCSDDIGNQVRVSIEEESGGLPAVKATVDFKYPLIIPFGGIVFAYNPKISGWDSGPAEGGLIASGDAVEEDSRQYLYIRESYTLAKPYKTETFPLAAEGDKPYLGIRTSGGTDYPIDEVHPIKERPKEPRVPQLPQVPLPEPIWVTKPEIPVDKILPVPVKPMPLRSIE